MESGHQELSVAGRDENPRMRFGKRLLTCRVKPTLIVGPWDSISRDLPKRLKKCVHANTRIRRFRATSVTTTKPCKHPKRLHQLLNAK